MATSRIAAARTRKTAARQAPRRSLQHAAIGAWGLVGVCVILLLVGHDAAAIATSHGTGAGISTVYTHDDVSADATVDHVRHAQAAHSDEAAPQPADQPCLTDQSGVVPLGTDTPDLPMMAPADAIAVAWLPPCVLNPSSVPSLAPAVRRALLQVYLN